MKPNIEWIDDWQIGVKPPRENQVSMDLLSFFIDFWAKEKLDEKSKTTMNRYSTSLHALGGYLVERAISDNDSEKTAIELLSEYISPDDGPLIYYENENWQDELDMVCRKIYRNMKKKR